MVRAGLALNCEGNSEGDGERASFNGATGRSDIEGKAARVAASKRGRAASFNSELGNAIDGEYSWNDTGRAHAP